MSPKNWTNIREGMLLRIFYILTTILGTLFLIWFVFFVLRGESVICFFKEIEQNKAQLQILILISGLPLFLLLWGFRTEDLNWSFLDKSEGLIGSERGRRQALTQLLRLKNHKKVFKEEIVDIIKGVDYSSEEGGYTLNLSNMNLSDLDFRGVSFSGSNLVRSNLNGANLEIVDLKRANLKLSNLQGANLTRAEIKDADLTGANFERADLTWVDLQEARLTNAELRGANLKNANIIKAILQEANLTDANLENANLQGADLTEAKLQGADLTGVNLKNTNLQGAYYNEQTKGLTKEQKKMMNQR